MKVEGTRLPGVMVIEPSVYRDDRGFFLETYRQERYAELLNQPLDFVQDNHSRSLKGVLRGLHAQQRFPQGKLVRVSQGNIYDVVVDIAPESPTLGDWVGVYLSDKNHRQVWIPPGYAHGFVVLSEFADVLYKCTGYYRPDDEVGIVWNDSDVGIEWPVQQPILSMKDAALPKLRELIPEL